MQLVAQYRQFAIDYRRLATTVTKSADKQALELFAIAWDRSAENREVMLRSEDGAASVDLSSAARYFFRMATGLNYEELVRAAFAVAIGRSPSAGFIDPRPE